MTESNFASLLSRRPGRPYAVRALLVFAVIVSTGICWFAIKKQQVDRQRKTVQTIAGLGGWVMLDNECDDQGFPRTASVHNGTLGVLGAGLPIVAGEPAGPKWLRRLVGDDFFSHARSARVENDAGMEHVSELPKLECLLLSGSHVTGTGLKRLGSLSHVRWLDLQCTRTTDDDLQHIKALKHLEGLYLGGTSVSDAGMAHIAGLSQLRELSLAGTPITDVGLERLEGLRQLRLLDIENTRVTDAGVKMLEEVLPKCEIHWSTRPPF